MEGGLGCHAPGGRLVGHKDQRRKKAHTILKDEPIDELEELRAQLPEGLVIHPPTLERRN
jgi:hypothetical protein